jgi:hypothetical protein
MASQVLSGSSNVSYTNNTGQNVRIVINYMIGTTSGLNINWGLGGTGLSGPTGLVIGRTITSSGNAAIFPTEIMLAPGQTFTALCGDHNIVVIPEAG